MKVAVNTLIVTPTSGGGKTFLTNLVRHISHIDKDTTYYLFLSPLNESLFRDLGENFKRVLIPFHSNNRLLRLFYQQFLLPYYIAKLKVNLLFSFGNIATLFPGCKQVVMVDGAQTLRSARRRYAPDVVSKTRAIYFDIMLPLSLKRASRVIAVCQFLKEELVKAGRIPEQKVSVVYGGVDLNNFSEKEGAIDSLNLPQPYILLLSDLYKHKNADKLIRAFSMLKGSYGIPHKLAIVGRNYGNQSEVLRQLAHELGVVEDTIFTGPVPYETIAGIYRKADIFVHPSTLESFPLPVLEAMACGTPVVGSNRTAIPEIVGDAGLIVDPDNVEALANSIYRVITDQSLRGSIIQKGHERVRKFTWEKTARETVAVFEEVCQS